MNDPQSGTTGQAPFGEYAACYDLLYRDKDYGAEAAFIARLIEKIDTNAGSPRLIDLACGTGRHIIELARLGYEADGSDTALAMVTQAREAASAAGLRSSFYNEMFQTCNSIGRQYDVALALFASLNYLTSLEDMAITLRNVRGLLSPQGIFIFDMWNGEMVAANFSPRREKRVTESDLEVVRVSNTTVDAAIQSATVDFQFTLYRGGKFVCKFSESHRLRYFMPGEMNDLLRANELEVVMRCPFMQPDRDVSANDWNVTYVVRASGPS